MQSSSTILAIAPALSSAQGEFTGIEKLGLNPAFKSQYITLDSIVATIRPVLAKHNLSIHQSMGQVYRSEEGRLIAVDVETTILHKSGEWIACTVHCPVMKPDVQGIGSSYTYGRRYGLCGLLGLAADIDDDGNAAVQPSQPERKPMIKTPSITVFDDEIK